jgi:hypothetical protein
MANCQISRNAAALECRYYYRDGDLLILFVHLIVTMARMAKPGGLRSVVAESVLAGIKSVLSREAPQN